MSHFKEQLKRKQSTLVVVHDHPRILLGMKKRGFGAGRWNGFGGKVEAGETVEEAAKRELREEAGIVSTDMKEAGFLEFRLHGEEFIRAVQVFKVLAWEGEIRESEEMAPRWFFVDEIPFASMWPDDLHWFPLFLSGRTFIGHASFDEQGKMVDFEFKPIS